MTESIIYKDVPMPKGNRLFLYVFTPDGTADRVHGTHIFEKDAGAYYVVREFPIKNGKWSGDGYEIVLKPGNKSAWAYLNSLTKFNSVDDCINFFKSQSIELTHEKAVEFLARHCPRTWAKIQEIEKFTQTNGG